HRLATNPVQGLELIQPGLDVLTLAQSLPPLAADITNGERARQLPRGELLRKSGAGLTAGRHHGVIDAPGGRLEGLDPSHSMRGRIRRDGATAPAVHAIDHME